MAYPFLIYNFADSLLSNPKLSSDLTRAAIQSSRNELIFTLVIVHLGYTAIIFITSLFLGHKIAGPIHKLKIYLSELRDGKSRGKLTFRKGDYFQELAEDFNGAYENIIETQKKDFMYLSEVNAYLNNLILIVPDDKKAILNEINKKLSEIQERYTA